MIGKVENASDVTRQANVDLQVSGLPDGCRLNQQLIIPGSPSFQLLAGEAKWVLYRVRYECHSPADAGAYELSADFCAVEEGEAPSDCRTTTRSVITWWDGIHLGIDVDARGDPASLAADLGSLEACGPVKSGDKFEADVYVTQVQDLFGWAGYLNYDPAILKVTNIDVWQFEGQNPWSLVKFYGDDLPDADGTFQVTGADLGPVSAGDTGTGVLARITLEAIGPGTSPLTITQPEIVNEMGVHLGDNNGDGYFDGPVINAQVAVDQDPDGDGLATPCGDPVPQDSDVDGDGASDLVEVGVGSNPQDPSDTPTLETACPAGSEPVYDDQGNFMGCVSVEEEVRVCDPAGSDFDGDGLEDSCDSRSADPTNQDGDGDTVPDPFEVYVGTDPRDSCPDDVNDPAWPFDINNDTWAGNQDIQLIQTSPAWGSHRGDANYNPRYDLNADGAVDDADIQLYTDQGVLNTQCSEGGQQAGPQGGSLLEMALRERQRLQEGETLQAAFYWNWNWPGTLYYREVTDRARHRICYKYWWFGWRKKCYEEYHLQIKQGWYYTGSHIFTWNRPTLSAGARFPYCLYNDEYTYSGTSWVQWDWSAQTEAYMWVTVSPLGCYCTPNPLGCPAKWKAINRLTFYGDGTYGSYHWGF